MWKVTFSNKTKRGTGFNRNAEEGEFMVELEPSICGWVYATPERYQFVDGKLIEYPGWVAESEAKELQQHQMDKISDLFIGDAIVIYGGNTYSFDLLELIKLNCHQQLMTTIDDKKNPMLISKLDTSGIERKLLLADLLSLLVLASTELLTIESKLTEAIGKIKKAKTKEEIDAIPIYPKIKKEK